MVTCRTHICCRFSAACRKIYLARCQAGAVCISAGVGETVEDLQPFNAEAFVDALFPEA